jgi:hypothetical protein
MRRLSRLLILVSGLSVWAVTASAEVSIKAFAGLWEGNAVSYANDSANFQITSRDLDVEIRPNADNSFAITWRTIQRQSGTPGAPEEVLKETTRTYLPKPGGKIWHASGGEGPYVGGAVSWAQLKGQALTIYSMAISDKGGYDMLIYTRTLTGLNMKLDFKALRNGEVRRTAGGTLIKSGK